MLLRFYIVQQTVRRGKVRRMQPEGGYEVIVIGAGAAGVGLGVALQHAGIQNYLILDRQEVGASFKRWPAEMRFITPSFPTNSIGMLDLNAVALGTSPAYSLKREHPSGWEYAIYLQAVALHFRLPVRLGVDVYWISAQQEGGFHLETSQGPLQARFVVWAAGEFQYPFRPDFPGAEFGKHNSAIDAYQNCSGRQFVVIGGYESGIDAALHLASYGKNVVVLDRNAPWSSESSDPSVSLSTYTQERMESPSLRGKITLAPNSAVQEISHNGKQFEVLTGQGEKWKTRAEPILATGFVGSTSLVQEWFEQREDGYPLLNEFDESTTTPGLFLSGPMVRHENHVFCFIYKFRQRFAVVADTIARRLGLDPQGLELYRNWGMFLDDLSCCGEKCVC